MHIQGWWGGRRRDPELSCSWTTTTTTTTTAATTTTTVSSLPSHTKIVRQEEARREMTAAILKERILVRLESRGRTGRFELMIRKPTTISFASLSLLPLLFKWPLLLGTPPGRAGSINLVIFFIFNSLTYPKNGIVHS